MSGKKMLKLFDRDLDLIEGIRVRDTHIAFARFAERIARHECEILFFQKLLTEIL